MPRRTVEEAQHRPAGCAAASRSGTGLPRLLTDPDWRGISVEDWVAPGTLLVSNLDERERSLPLPRNSCRSARNLLGTPLVTDGQMTLRPMELALVRV